MNPRPQPARRAGEAHAGHASAGQAPAGQAPASLAPAPALSPAKVLLMNLGFLGLQFSFGLQQGNMGPIYSYLGASQANLPLLTLAGPVTGLLVQPLIGVLSDRTTTRWGRRIPYVVAGAVLCSLCLLLLPLSPTVFAAASLLWVLDTANNMTMEPYRAFVSDRLPQAQRKFGFLTQSAFTGLAQTLAYAAPPLLVAFGLGRDRLAGNGIPLVTLAIFDIGAAISLVTILVSAAAVREPPSPRAAPAHSVWAEFAAAILAMPAPMRRMAWMSLFQWFAMSCYWGYVVYAIADTVFHAGNPASAGFRSAVLANGEIGAFYNLVAAISAFAMVPAARRIGSDRLHAACLLAGGAAMLAMPAIHEKSLLFPCVIGIGLAWGSMMGNPYVMLADSIPPERTGVYMGIFNMFIVIPMVIYSLVMPFLFAGPLHARATNVLLCGGAAMLLAAAAALRVRPGTPGRA